MQRLMNQWKLQATLSNKDAKTRVGEVTSYDPDNYCAKVKIQPEEVETGWLPISSPFVGDQWGIFAPPSVGDLVVVHYQENDIDSGIIGNRLYNDVDRPVSCESAVFFLIHKSGSFLKFTNDGKVALTGVAGIELDGDGTEALKGIVQGDCVCAYTGNPHPHISASVKGSK